MAVASPISAIDIQLSPTMNINPYTEVYRNQAETPDKAGTGKIAPITIEVSQLGTVSPSDIIVNTSVADMEVNNPYDEFYGNMGD